MALSRGVPPRPQVFVAQADAQPFAALLDAAVSPAPDRGAGAPAAAVPPNQQKPAADAGAAAQSGAAASPSAAPAGNTAQAAAASDSSTPTQKAGADATQGAAANNAGDGKPGAAPDASGSATMAAAAPAIGAPIQTADTGGTHQTAAKNDGDRKPGPPLNTNQPAIAMPPPLSSAGGNPNKSSGTSANPTSNATAQSANDPAEPGAIDANKNASHDTAAVAAAAAILTLSGSASANGATPAATKPSGDGKDDDKDQQNGAADATTAVPAASQAQPLPPDAGQPVATAAVVNAAPDPAPAAAAKPGLTIADAVRSRVKVPLTPAATEQSAPAQDATADAPRSNAALDLGGSDASSASPGSNDPSGDASATNAQQVLDQPQAPGTNGAALLTQIDFAPLSGTERFGLRGDTAASANAAAASAAPNAATNAAMASSFGIFAPAAIATNMVAPAAAASEPAVPLAGLAVAIAARAQAGSSQFDIRLDPPELGRIDVRLDVDGSGQVRTHVTVDRADTLQLLQSQQPQLERALEQAGLKTADNGLQFTLRDQSFAGQNGGSGGQYYANQPAAPLVIPDIDAAPIDTAQIYARLRFGNGLDISV